MSQERRRKGRVQGGWAATGSKSGPRSDQNKPKVAPTPAWVASKSVDQPALQKKFVYQESAQEIKQKIPDKCISKPGVYDISNGPEAGISRLRYFPGFFEEENADNIFRILMQELPWKQQMNEKYKAYEPRLTVWYGDLPYKYSGVLQTPDPEWHPQLRQIKDHLEDVTGYLFNSMLGNLYRDGKDSIDWHSDDETCLGPNPTIVSLSFGDQRNFELRKKVAKVEDYEYTEHIKIPLTSGSLLIMEGATQEDWQHRVPKEYHDRGSRINLTFRVILPDCE